MCYSDLSATTGEALTKTTGFLRAVARVQTMDEIVADSRAQMALSSPQTVH